MIFLLPPLLTSFYLDGNLTFIRCFLRSTILDLAINSAKLAMVLCISDSKPTSDAFLEEKVSKLAKLSRCWFRR